MDYELILKICSEGTEVFNEASKLLEAGKEESNFQTSAKQLKWLKDRFATQKLTILIAGEVSTGKSTFLNTLLGEEILSTANETCTNVPTKIVYGEKEKITVYFNQDENGQSKGPIEISKDELVNYTTETKNERNKENVEYIEVEIDSPLLFEGLAFIDTPGLGAIDPLHAITTYKIAGQADIIFFLGDVRKPLTESEVESLKNLIKVSDSKHVVHLLSSCDLGKFDTILDNNKTILSKGITDFEIKSMPISSMLYRRYLKTNDRNKLDDSGFQVILSYISDLNSQLKSILNSRFASLVYAVCKTGHDDLATLIESVDNPVIKEQKVKQLKGLVDRLNDIDSQKTSWQQKLGVDLNKLSVEISSFIEDEKANVRDRLVTNLENDFYLKDKDALSNSITADLIKFQSDLDRKMNEGYSQIYKLLRSETGLKEIQEQTIQLPESVALNISVSKDTGNSFKGAKIRNAFMAGSIGITIGTVASGVGGWAGTLAGAKVGAVIGTTIAPGIGSAIGTILGGVAGIVAGFKIWRGGEAARKEQLRNKIRAVCDEQINRYFSKVVTEIKMVNIPNTSDISMQFVNEVQYESKRLKEQLSKLSNEAERIRRHYDAIKTLISDSWKLCQDLSKV